MQYLQIKHRTFINPHLQDWISKAELLLLTYRILLWFHTNMCFKQSRKMTKV